MTMHPALTENNVAVITGAADGIGLAAAKHYAQLGMRVCMADINGEALEAAAAEIDGALAQVTDVTDVSAVEKLRDAALAEFGQVDVLMNNAGIPAPTHSWRELDNWNAVLQVNLHGVINGVHSFTQVMVDQGTPGLIINTGSKQGITCPPGNPAYNVSKAAVKALTEALQHDLRNTENCKVNAHLLVPGFVYSGMVRQWLPEKPEGAWTCEETIEFMIESLNRDDFYIICPDNDVDRPTDNKRMTWAMGDLVENRPPLSRWHPDYASVFEDFMATN